MRLKTLKELVDEYGNRLSFYKGRLELEGAEQNDQYIYQDELSDLGKDLGDDYYEESTFTPPSWAIKQPEKKKLYAYKNNAGDVGFHEDMKMPNSFRVSGMLAIRAPGYDLEFEQ